MDRIKLIFIYFSIGLSFSVRGQEIGNYVNNGSFEDLYSCLVQPTSLTTKYWSCPDSSKFCASIYHKCWGNVPNAAVGFQYPKDGDSFIRLSMFCTICPSQFSRSNIKNRLKKPLSSGKTYCVKMYVNLIRIAYIPIDGFGLYLGDSSIDTIIYNARLPLIFLTPQISNPNGNIITDTLNWVPITGTFVATGSEKYLIAGNFKSDNSTSTLSSVSTTLGGSEYFVDAISCIELDLPAFAGPNKPCIPGDSVFIGRQPDFAIDSGCVWYKLPNMTTAIDTVSGLWVKPTTTSTYVVRQELDCSPLKWDTVVVFMNPVSSHELQWYSVNINLFPNPTVDNITISFSTSGSADINKISIINSLGQTIREVDIEIKNNSFTLQTSDLDNGIYQVQFKTKAGTLTKQFVKN